MQLFLQAVVADLQRRNGLEGVEELLLVAVELALEELLELGLGLAEALPEFEDLPLEIALPARLEAPALVGAALLQGRDFLLQGVLLPFQLFPLGVGPYVLLLQSLDFFSQLPFLGLELALIVGEFVEAAPEPLPVLLDDLDLLVSNFELGLEVLYLLQKVVVLELAVAFGARLRLLELSGTFAVGFRAFPGLPQGLVSNKRLQLRLVERQSRHRLQPVALRVGRFHAD